MTFIHGNPSKLTHGHARRGQQSAEHRCWLAIKNRCLRPSHSKFVYYGGRGITICVRWKDSFEYFLEDVGPRPSPLHSIDRYPNKNGNYEPGNVRWATRREQWVNRDITRKVVFRGREIALSELCRGMGVDLKVVRNRIDIGWDIKRALTTPIKKVPYRPRRKKERAK